MPRPRLHPGPAARSRSRRAFSIVELLVVVGVLVVLVGLLIVALTQAGEAGRTASTRSLMQSMVQASVQFEQDFGYYPPITDPAITLPFAPPRNVPDLSQPDFQYGLQANLWYSVTDPVRFLVGTGQEDTSVPAAANAGGYLVVEDPDLIAVLDETTPIGPDGYFVTTRASETADYDEDRRVILDYWGRPIRFYRHQHQPGLPGEVYRSNTLPDDALRLPSLADAVNLRPYDIESGTLATDGLPDANGDTTVTPSLKAARFAFLSLGPDRLLTPRQRVDQDGFNRDNLVELGP